MKIACCQFNPVFADWEANATKANNLLSKYQPGDIDVLVLPEMALTGYMFESVEEITPFLEDATTGPTVTWAKEQALRLNSFVVVGYPEKAIVDGHQKNYNSSCFVDRQGNLILTYRKTFLYATDEIWSEEGPGFVSHQVDTLGKVGLGICMDVNPYQFTAPFDAYEFTRFHQQQETELLLCSMAWLTFHPEQGRDAYKEAHNWWAGRLHPLAHPIDPKHRTVFVVCNRTGTERGTFFLGGSCVVIVNKNSIRTVGYLDSYDEGVLLATV